VRNICEKVHESSEILFGQYFEQDYHYVGWSFHSGYYEECSLLGCGAVWVYYKPTFRRNLSSVAIRISANRIISPAVTFLPYARPIFSRIRRGLARHNAKSLGLPHKKVSSFLRPAKDNLGIRTPGVYRIPCECGKVCIGQTGRPVDTTLRELQRHLRLEHPGKSAVSEHCAD
jgi:hypothetical protein